MNKLNGVLFLPLRNHSGQSLVQMLIVIGVMSIVMTIFATMMSGQQRAVQGQSQKMATMDIQRVVTSVLADPSAVCTRMVSASPLTAFDPMAISATTPVYNFATIPTKGVAGAPAAVGVSTTTPASLLSTSLFVNSIKLSNFACVPAPCTATSNTFTANLSIGFDNTTLITPLAALQFPITINTTGAANAQVPTSCPVNGNGGGSGPSHMVLLTSGSGSWSVPNGVSQVKGNVIGGAGGGAGSGADDGSGGCSIMGQNGGSGGTAIGAFTVTPGGSIAYSVGGGGTAGVPSGNGGSGTSTTFGSLVGGGATGGLSGPNCNVYVGCGGYPPQPNGTATGGTMNYNAKVAPFIGTPYGNPGLTPGGAGMYGQPWLGACSPNTAGTAGIGGAILIEY